MAYPKYMDDEMLAVFGYTVSPENPTHAIHSIYPDRTKMDRCPKCGIWAGKLFGGKVLVCEQCYRDKPPFKINKQYRKVYQCCSNGNCETWKQIISLFKRARLGTDNHHDRFGAYLVIEFPSNWTLEKKLKFHLSINKHCRSVHMARRAVCGKTKTTRSKLPTK